MYRNLETLERAGLVRHFHAGHGPGLYALAARTGGEYLVCESCGRVLEAKAGELDRARELIRDRFGFEARFSHFPIVGSAKAAMEAALAAVDFEFLFRPVEELDTLLTGLFDGAAARGAGNRVRARAPARLDPDHLVAVTSLVRPTAATPGRGSPGRLVGARARRGAYRHRDPADRLQVGAPDLA